MGLIANKLANNVSGNITNASNTVRGVVDSYQFLNTADKIQRYYNKNSKDENIDHSKRMFLASALVNAPTRKIISTYTKGLAKQTKLAADVSSDIAGRVVSALES